MTNDQAPMTKQIQNPESKIQNRERIRPLLATCFGLGLSPIMPGTCGALVGPAIYVPLALAIPSEPLQTALIAAALLAWCAITVALGGWAETYYNEKDSQTFVTDEVAGFLLTVLLFHDPARPVLTTLWAFPVTRIIDILKIPPARRLERLPRGWGVLADDLLGSVYAAVLLYGVCAGFDSFLGGCVIHPHIMNASNNQVLLNDR
jgi:phosphatidylglycerophosphatase A